MKMSIEQARRASIFVSTSEKTWKSLENSSPMGRAGFFALNAKIAEITRQTDANFALAVKLVESKDPAPGHGAAEPARRNQMETFAAQLEEMRDLVAKFVQEANPTEPQAPLVTSDAGYAPTRPRRASRRAGRSD